MAIARAHRCVCPRCPSQRDRVDAAKLMVIASVGAECKSKWPSCGSALLPVHDGHIGCSARGVLRDGHAPGEHTLDRFTIDGLAFPARSITHRAVCYAVNVA